MIADMTNVLLIVGGTLGVLAGLVLAGLALRWLLLELSVSDLVRVILRGGRPKETP